MVASVLGVKLKSRMWEIYKSGSVRGVDVRYSRFKKLGTSHTERVKSTTNKLTQKQRKYCESFY